MLVVILMLALNFAISWSNATICGRYWSESKREGGSLRVYMVCGYIQSIFDGLCIHPFADCTGIYADERYGC